MIKVIDNALSERTYNDLIAQIACGVFCDEQNPADNIIYPKICRAIPKSVADEISEIVSGEYVEFLRASPKGVHCPNPVHHDGSMGRISIMLYTSNIGGTAIMRHLDTGVMAGSNHEQITNRLRRDSSDISKWQVMELAEAKPNRMAIFDAQLMHAALPFGGSGEGVKARTVYTRFVK